MIFELHKGPNGGGGVGWWGGAMPEAAGTAEDNILSELLFPVPLTTGTNADAPQPATETEQMLRNQTLEIMKMHKPGRIK